MTDRTDPPDTRGEVDPDVATLLGLRPTDADPVPDATEIDGADAITDTAIYEGELVARPLDGDQPDGPGAESLEFLTDTEARAGETDDPYEASDEGLAWVPPVDPPTRVGADGELDVAAGFGTTAEDEPFDADHHAAPVPAEDERTARIVEALRADARTSGFADALVVETDGGRAIVAGVVEDLDDEDAAIAVIEDVAGITDVVSRIAVAALERQPDRS